MKPTSGREFIEGGGGGRNGVKVLILGGFPEQ